MVSVNTRDEGYAWVILFACAFLITLSVGGLVGTFELMFSVFVKYYDVTETEISWLGTLQCGAFGFAGWVSGPLTKRFNCRLIAIIGSVMATIGLVCTQFADKTFVYITYGLIAGSGFGMIHLVAIVSVQQWFDAWRCRALAIMFCGVGIGTFAWPPISALLLHHFSVGGTLLLLAGLQMQGLWCGALMLSFPESTEDILLSRESEATVVKKAEYHLVRTPNYFTDDTETLSDVHRDQCNTMATRAGARRPRRARPLSTGFLEGSPIHPRTQQARCIARLETQGLLEELSASHGLDTFMSSRDMHKLRTFTSHTEDDPGSRSPTLPLPHARRGPLHSASILIDFIEDNQAHGPTDVDINASKAKRYTWGAFDTNFDALDYKNTGNDDAGTPNVVYQLRAPESMSSASSQTLSLITNSGISVFKDASYVIFILGSLVESMGFFTPLHYLPMRAVAVGKEQHEVVLILSVFAVFSLLARTVAGVVGDKFPTVRCWICCGCLALAGILTALTSFSDHYTTLIIYAAGLGVGAAFYLVLKNAVIVDFWGLYNMPYITGHLFACTGLAAVMMHPFSQFLVNLDGNWSKPFLVIGCLQFLGGLAMFTTTVIKMRQSV